MCQEGISRYYPVTVICEGFCRSVVESPERCHAWIFQRYEDVLMTYNDTFYNICYSDCETELLLSVDS